MRKQTKVRLVGVCCVILALAIVGIVMMMMCKARSIENEGLGAFITPAGTPTDESILPTRRPTITGVGKDQVVGGENSNPTTRPFPTKNVTSVPTVTLTPGYWERAKDVEFKYSLNMDVLADFGVQEALAQKVSYLYSKHLGIDKYRVSCKFTQVDATAFPEGICIYEENSKIYVNYRCEVVQREGNQFYVEHKTFLLFYGEDGLQISIKE